MRGPEPAVLRADWPVPAGIAAFTTLRHGAGISRPPFDSFNLGTRHGADGDDPGAIAHNRGELLERFGLPSPPRWLRQMHGTTVAVEPGFDEPEADAAVTRVPGVVLAILTADCLPVVFAAADGREVAVAHAGWQGLSDGVLGATIAAMRTPAGRILAWLGPAAGPQAYEVGDDVFAAFVARDPQAAGAFVTTRPGHWLADLYALARQQLAGAGVTRVFGGGLCTISDPRRFFSHRRDARTGRMATLVYMPP